MELIMKAASRSSCIPFSAKDAEMGIVPYIQSGDAMPMSEAGISPKTPKSFACIAANME